MVCQPTQPYVGSLPDDEQLHWLDMEDPSMANYRQVGKNVVGRVRRGAVHIQLYCAPESLRVWPAGFIAGQHGAAPKQTASIPSKFETTLFTGNKERDGFGNRAHRFVETEANPATRPCHL